MTQEQLNQIVHALTIANAAVRNLDVEMPEWEQKVSTALDLAIDAASDKLRESYKIEN